MDILKEIKFLAGEDFPVQYKVGLRHYVKQNNRAALPGEKYCEACRDIEESLEMLKRLEEAGYDSFHVDAGCYESHYWTHPPVYQDDGCMTDMAQAAKKC